MADFLLELLSEEIPARMQARAAEDLQRLFIDRLAAASLTYQTVTTHVTPRRLALVVGGLPSAQPDLREERKGPREDAPQKAIDGFLRSTGLTLDRCELRDTGKGRAWFAVVERPGRPTAEVLPELVVETVRAMPWPKSMCWGETEFRWVRPLIGILALFDGRPLAGAFEPDAGLCLPFTDRTRGHRFLAPGEFAVASAAEYETGLEAARVLLDRDRRRQEIARQARTLAEAEGLALVEDPGLLDEVAGLVEWPVGHSGRIDDAFMDLPAEVLTTSMRTHQRYFACRTADGALAPRFVVIANTETRDGGAKVVAGNEKVLRARLSDAKFFWDQDRSRPLHTRVPQLREIVFHARLGSMAEKVERVQELAVEVARTIGADPDRAASAARLAKADLVTGLVGEFPELQGVMGRYYALHDGEHPEVAQAIAEHYAPRGPADPCPRAPVSVAVALADKIDTLAGFFGIGEIPTGSRDPYALRRAALGVIRLVRENGLRLDLRWAFELAHGLYGDRLEANREKLRGEVASFFVDRLAVVLREEGLRHDVFSALFGKAHDKLDILLLIERARALQAFLDSTDGTALLTGYRRARNIYRQASAEGLPDTPPNWSDLLSTEPERALLDALMRARNEAGELDKREDHEGLMHLLAGLKPPIDAFFDAVLVNVEDDALRRSRLELLYEITTVLEFAGHLNVIEGR